MNVHEALTPSLAVLYLYPGFEHDVGQSSRGFIIGGKSRLFGVIIDVSIDFKDFTSSV